MAQLVVGRDLGWKAIIEVVFRVESLDRNGTTTDARGNVYPKSATAPYGFLRVVAPMIHEMELPITHQADYLLAEAAFDSAQLVALMKSRRQELLVTYVPKKSAFWGRLGLSGFHHGLHYVAAPFGTMERFYAASIPTERLFGPYVYESSKLKLVENPGF